MVRFVVCSVAALAAACSGGPTYSWSFDHLGGCPALVETIRVSATSHEKSGGECFGHDYSVGVAMAPCSDGELSLEITPRPAGGCVEPDPGVAVHIEALTADGGIYAQQETSSSGGHTTFPSGLGLTKLVWTIEDKNGSATSCPTGGEQPPAVQTSFGGSAPCADGSGYVPGQPPGTYDVGVTLVEFDGFIQTAVGSGSASISVTADTITTAPVVIRETF